MLKYHAIKCKYIKKVLSFILYIVKKLQRAVKKELYKLVNEKSITWPPHMYGWGVGLATVGEKKGGAAPAP